VSTHDELYYRRNPHTAWQIMEDGGVILDLQAHELSATNATGAVLWQALDSPKTARQLSADLAREFAVTPDEALSTVRAFLDQLQAKGLVEPVTPQ
jgi:hypothetical protein